MVVFTLYNNNGAKNKCRPMSSTLSEIATLSVQVELTTFTYRFFSLCGQQLIYLRYLSFLTKMLK